MSGLKYQDGHYDLVKLHDKEYQDKLQVQSDYWEKLKIEIEAVRSKGYENTDIVNMSETYFKMADETVSAAENYSVKYLRREKDRLNGNENPMSIDYACGWALSEDYKECTMQILLDKADSYMYDNKQLCKQHTV